MEAREILVKNTRDQKTYKVTTDATTLGELKAALDNEGVDYAGMDFTEGISNTILVDDSSLLPTNVKYKGQITNNLVFLLTNTKKNIASGISAEREQVYEAIRKYDLQEEIKEVFGRNFTLVSTSDLWDFINENVEDVDVDEEEEEEEQEEPECDCYGNTCSSCDDEVNPMEFINNLYDLLKALVKTQTISYKEVAAMAELTQELASRLKELQEKTSIGNIEISEDDLNEMLAKL
jgi:hypothetical protein